MSDTGAEIRRYKSNIIISGRAILIFGVWTIIKVAMSLLWGDDVIQALTSDFDPNLPEEIRFLATIVALIVLLLIFILMFLIHLYIGGSAIRYGNSIGKPVKKKKGFLVAAALLFCSVLVLLPSYFYFGGKWQVSDTNIASFIADVTLLIAIADLFISCWKVSKIEKEAV